MKRQVFSAAFIVVGTSGAATLRAFSLSAEIAAAEASNFVLNSSSDAEAVEASKKGKMMHLIFPDIPIFIKISQNKGRRAIACGRTFE